MDYIACGAAQLWEMDNLLVPHRYDDDHFQLLITSTPYPNQRGFMYHPDDYLRWWKERLEAWLPKINQSTGVVAQVIKYKRVGGWFDDRVFELTWLYRHLGMNIVDVYIWDKLNAPPSGNHDRHDRDEYEFVFVGARSHNYTKNAVRRPYAAKTVGKAKTGNKMRQADVAGSMAGGHSALHPEGALQGNVLRISSSGDQGRPRVEGGVFPRELAERLILTFSNEGDTIVDPCCGSGTSLVVAVQNDRFAVGVDDKRNAIRTSQNWLMSIEQQGEEYGNAF
jgi:site-specific DNA-methyltransferase (adenine-specific)